MDVVEFVPGIPYEHPVELPNRRAQPVSKQTIRKASGNGVKKPRNPLTPVVTGKLATELKKADQEITEANRTVVTLVNGKCRILRLADYERMRDARDVGSAHPAAG